MKDEYFRHVNSLLESYPMAHSLHVTGSKLFARHHDNMLASLSRRLEIARATNNMHLVELLEQERKQIATEVNQSRSLMDWFAALQKRIQMAIARRSELQVSHLVSGRDEWWYAFNPQTGQYVYADSEAELRLWIKENYQGR